MVEDDNIQRCSWIGCGVRKSCARYVAPWIKADGQGFSAFYADESFTAATGCDYFEAMPGIEGRIVADFDKARE